MSFVDDLLIILTSYHGGYRLMRQKIFGYGPSRRSVRAAATFRDGYLRVTLSRLRQRGLVQHENGLWRITKKGKEYIGNKIRYKKQPNLPQRNKKNNNMVLVFDIPERYRKERDWLRVELRGLEFVMLQKSVWFGPAPLPKNFIATLDDLKILRFMKFFKAQEWDVISG